MIQNHEKNRNEHIMHFLYFLRLFLVRRQAVSSGGVFRQLFSMLFSLLPEFAM